MQRPMKLNFPSLINDFEDFFILLFISIKTSHNCIIGSIHDLIELFHRSFFFTFNQTKHMNKGPKTYKQNTIVFQNEGIITLLAIVFSFSFAHLLFDQSELVNIFFKLFFCSCNHDNMMKAVANRVLADLSNFLCPINHLIMLSSPERL